MRRARRKLSQNGPLDKDRAFQVLFRKKTFASVWHWLERLGVPIRDRRDVSQEVLMAAHQSFHTYDPMRSRPERWLNKITVHVAAHYRDRAQHRREELTPDDAFEVIDEQPGPDEQIMLEQDRLEVIDVLQTLEVDLRSVLIAHDIDGIPMMEIADQHGIPLSTAYKWRARAVTAFKAAVEQRRREENERIGSGVVMVPFFGLGAFFTKLRATLGGLRALPGKVAAAPLGLVAKVAPGSFVALGVAMALLSSAPEEPAPPPLSLRDERVAHDDMPAPEPAPSPVPPSTSPPVVAPPSGGALLPSTPASNASNAIAFTPSRALTSSRALQGWASARAQARASSAPLSAAPEAAAPEAAPEVGAAVQPTMGSSASPAREANGADASQTARDHDYERAARRVRLLDSARSAIKSGNAEETLGVLARYESEFGTDSFAPDCMRLRGEALLLLGQQQGQGRREAQHPVGVSPIERTRPQSRELLGSKP
ncbi:RNA polymerase sigma factor [Chondromyces apiculatus]|uniref:RNA polymerase sigma factor n=1 Tax=Chondromyces apiculatus DSM 436 TaxID=1192034 RepID=A0A017TCR0_9BACT|nr:sigma-70 family RNA polymerase sigma factor [Chondromyces apiculatus]EYF07024.1 RNA polymerase sigma factor [Chondromyces apiculatus DSM 436]